MQSFLREMETFSSLASEVREKERVVLVGTNPWFMETRYFSQWLERLRESSRIEVRLVEIAGGTERSMVDSGSCDVYIGPNLISGKRLSHVDLPVMAAGICLNGNQVPPRSLEDLESIRAWGIHLPGLSSQAAEWLQAIKVAGGGSGRLISSPNYLEWSASPLRSQLEAVIAPIPAKTSAVWHPFKPLGGIRIRATALSQHPYDFLGAAIQAAAANFMEHDGNL